MFKIFKPYMLLLLILLASSSIAMAQDCGGCPLGYVCEQADCIIDVDLDRDLDGVPDAVDSCPDVSNPPQNDWDLDGIGDACDDDVQGVYVSGYARYYPNHSRSHEPLRLAGLRIYGTLGFPNPGLREAIEFGTTIADEYGQFFFRNVPVGEWTLEVYEHMSDFITDDQIFDRDPIHTRNLLITDQDRSLGFIDLTEVFVNHVQIIEGQIRLEDVANSQNHERLRSHGGIKVTIITEEEEIFEVFTNEYGEFISPSLLTEQSYRINFSKEGYHPLSINIELRTYGNPEPIDLFLEKWDEIYTILSTSCQNIDCFNQELLEHIGLGDYDNALLTAMKSVEFADNNFKGLDAQMALAYNNLGFVHFKMDNPEKAERAYIQALQIWEETLGSDHPNVGASLNNLAALYEKAGGYKQAEEYRKRSKEIWQKAQEEASADICDSMTELLFDCPTDNNNGDDPDDMMTDGDEPIFDDIDNDRDGCINEDEFKTIQNIMTRLEVDPSDMTTNEELLLFNDIDENDDGCISKEEFHKALDEN